MLRHSVLLVKPAYYSRYPPIALMKFSSFFKKKCWKVAYVDGLTSHASFYPQHIYVTSLYTYEWRSVHDACLHYKKMFPRSSIDVGGVYATLMPDRLEHLGIQVHTGLCPELDEARLDYSLFPSCTSSFMSATRGCIRRCSFCAVKYLEPNFECVSTIRDQVEARHTSIVMWDNNFWRHRFGT
jgi:hypothetical protein